MREIELKFLDINVKEIKDRLKQIGAILKYDTDTISYPFTNKDFSSYDSTKNFLRLRKINRESFITYKSPASKSNITDREEIEIKVDNFKEAIKLLERIGFEKGKVFKKHRIHYEMENAHFELDTVGDIPTYLEIETRNERDMINICNKLDLDIKKGKKGTIVEIYPEKFNK